MLSAVHVLVTGFEPFGGLPYNPSQAAVEGLPDEIGGVPLRKRILPVDTVRIAASLEPLWSTEPMIVVHAGLAETRTTLTIERQATNRLAFERPDNAGCIKFDGEILPGGPSSLSARIHTDAVVNAWRNKGLNGFPSDSAGGFLCNQTFYLSLHALPETTAVAFVHLPPDEILDPHGHSFTHMDLIRGLELVVRTALERLDTHPTEAVFV